MNEWVGGWWWMSVPGSGCLVGRFGKGNRERQGKEEEKIIEEEEGTRRTTRRVGGALISILPRNLFSGDRYLY